MARFSSLLSLPLTIALAGAEGRAQCSKGAWEEPFDHAANPVSGTCDPNFPWVGFENAVHMSLIPRGPRQGWVLMWPHDHYDGDPVTEQRYHRWALVDPKTGNVLNFCSPLPAEPGKGDLFCAGHAWTATGDLLVVGGTGQRVGAWGGSVLAYLWTPPMTSATSDGGQWTRILEDLDEPRWYPSIVALGPDPQLDEDRLLVGGGTDFAVAVNSYQVWRPTAGAGSWESNPVSQTNTFAGPPGGSTYDLHNYPRMVLMSGGAGSDLARVMTAGMVSGSDRVGHYANPGIWLNATWAQAHQRIYGTSVLLPVSPGGILKDWVLSVGGQWWQGPPPGTFFIENTAQVTNGGGSGAGSWSSAPAMAFKRWVCNSVLLPDSTVAVFGGEQQWPGLDCSELPALVPERYDLQTNQWTTLAADEIVRTYHSGALLLPSGKVLTGGGDRRRELPQLDCSGGPNGTPNPLPSEDYRVFVPGYIQCGQTRPVPTNAPASGSALGCSYGGACQISYQNLPFPLTIDKVVLMRPGSVTHHADTNQRCVELDFTIDLPIPGGSNALVTATIPSKTSGLLPRGYYMLFLVTNQRVPSEAVWVNVQ